MSGLAAVIEHWWEVRKADRSRPPNVQELYDHLVADHEYSGSEQAVRPYTLNRFGPPTTMLLNQMPAPGPRCPSGTSGTGQP